MEVEVEYVSLEEIEKGLGRKHEELKKVKENLDNLLKIIKEINKLEIDLSKRQEKVKNVFSALKLFFDDINLEDLEKCFQELKDLDDDIEESVSTLINEIPSKKFSKEILEQYRDTYREKAKQWMESIDKILKNLEQIFTRAVNDLKSEFEILERLIRSVERKIKADSAQSWPKLVNILHEILHEVENTKNKILIGLEELAKTDINRLKGLYKATKEEINRVRNSVRELAIKNGLLSENELKVLEVLIEENVKDAYIETVVKNLRKRLSLSKNDIRDLLFSLAESGFITLKVDVM